MLKTLCDGVWFSFFLQVTSDTLWLRERLGQGAFFPTEDNTDFGFPLDGELNMATLIVEGRPIAETPAPTPDRISSASTSRRNAGPGPVLPLGGKKSAALIFPLKIIQAIITKQNSNGRPEFLKMGEFYLEIIESTANITFINHAIKERWGKEYVLVSSNGLKIEDSSATRG